MKMFHDFELKDGTRIVLVRALFHPVFGYQVVHKGERWDALRMTFSKGKTAYGEIVDRKMIGFHVRQAIKKCRKKIGEL